MASKKKSVKFVDDATSAAEQDVQDNFDPNETILQRIYALKDIVPVQSRRQIYENVSTASGYIRIVAGFVGIAAWVLSTSALLVVVPLGIELEREQMFIQQENEFKLQQQQAQQMLQPQSVLMAPK